jgi:UDP-3-O-[3-hydroxymyristoyl] glucosamine N-acyltransferase
VDNVLLTMSQITSKFYPESINDDFDNTVKEIEKVKFENSVKYGHNVLIGENVKIGKNCLIGHNTIIEKNVIIGSNCSIGSNVILRNTLLRTMYLSLMVVLLEKKVLVFFPINKKT